jgi:hypothetical protein
LDGRWVNGGTEWGYGESRNVLSTADSCRACDEIRTWIPVAEESTWPKVTVIAGAKRPDDYRVRLGRHRFDPAETAAATPPRARRSWKSRRASRDQEHAAAPGPDPADTRLVQFTQPLTGPDIDRSERWGPGEGSSGLRFDAVGPAVRS